jgi:hypothetical protein
MNKEYFALYLEDLAAEIRMFPLTQGYLDDVYESLIELAKRFYYAESERARLRGL